VPAVIAEFRIAVVQLSALPAGWASAAAASAQPNASIQGIWFDTIMPFKYHFCLIDVHR
jgi:hypothetical protein